MYSLSLFPTITKPSRITSQSATLTDNILTNNIEDNFTSGLLINDISDHLPVFMIHNCECILKDEISIQKRIIRTEESLNEFKRVLMSQDWREVFEAQEVNMAYNTFFFLNSMIKVVQFGNIKRMLKE